MNPVPTTNPVQVLRNAADYLEANGWTQLAFFRFAGGEPPAACSAGAIQIAVTGGPVDVFADNYRQNPANSRQFAAVLEAIDVLVSHLRREHHTAALTSMFAASALARWNDRTGRTLAEVVTAMREAADRHDTAGGGAR
ncbi:hypothetical protein RB614_37545 [Phytohabitans sp. ZYX-F-186]|uniref:Uncharacterized protein n=1 Tax=Phytohabitans maris TaxID=3071409 RepID=A0ABU0ZT50_9ACTN|nr:hypothetical protein [Phytohabitans sp. ZYX-F-186]MDQ7910216.1 hypothetical protein [Phytohabitans sp. ZYX-F-186]